MADSVPFSMKLGNKSQTSYIINMLGHFQSVIVLIFEHLKMEMIFSF